MKDKLCQEQKFLNIECIQKRGSNSGSTTPCIVKGIFHVKILHSVVFAMCWRSPLCINTIFNVKLKVTENTERINYDTHIGVFPQNKYILLQGGMDNSLHPYI